MDMAANAKNTQELKAFARDLGFDLFGVADVSAMRDGFLLEPPTRARLTRAVSLGKGLSDAVLEDIRDRPTALYLHHYRQTNYFLDRGALLVADRIQERGFRSLAIAASQIVDWENQKAHLSHKHVGRAAGLGWFGQAKQEIIHNGLAINRHCNRLAND